MTRLSIATWNINSVRLRIGRVREFLDRVKPDVLCLQEIKCRDGEFPAAAFVEAGYPHLHVVGQKGLHGVAVASRLPLEPADAPELCRHAHARCASVRIAGLDIHNLYVPAGGDVADPVENEKFAHKLDFIARMQDAYARRAADASSPPLVLVGDLNIAPGEHDVWSHRQLLDVVSHTPVETDGLNRVIAAGGFTDIARVAHMPDEKLFTWWSYRAADWRASNRGRRLDHIWASRSAAPCVDPTSFRIHTAERDGEKPSDHVPVSVSLSV